MIKPHPAITLAVALFSCSSPAGKSGSQSARPDSSKHTDSVAVNTPPPARNVITGLDTAVQFSGLWVNVTYLQRLNATHSPRLSQGIMKSCIIVPARTLQVTRMIAGFYDGAADMVLKKSPLGYCFYWLYNDQAGDTV